MRVHIGKLNLTVETVEHVQALVKYEKLYEEGILDDTQYMHMIQRAAMKHTEYLLKTSIEDRLAQQ